MRVRALLALLAAVVGAPAGADTPEAVAAAARDAAIVVLGEIHDNPAHHAAQAAIVAALDPAAIVFEMIPRAAEDEANRLRRAGAERSALAEAIGWDALGWPDFAFYAPILEAAPGALVVGAGQPATDVRRAAAEGAAASFGPDAGRYGLDRALPAPDQAEREAAFAAAHCGKLPAAMLPGMVEAQRFRDAGLADAALRARRLTGDGQVVVIAGSGHADRAWGMPAMLAVAAPDLRVFSLGQTEGGAAPDGDFDAVLSAAAPEREDPCAAFE